MNALVALKNQVPGFYNYTQQPTKVKEKFQLVHISDLEQDVFAPLIDISNEQNVPSYSMSTKPKTDLPLSSDFGDVDPRWLLFARSGLKKLQYK